MFLEVDEYFENNPHGILIEKANNNADMEMSSPHIHNFYEIYYLVDGNSNYIIGDDIFYLESKNLVLIPPGTPHKSSTVTDLNRINIYIGKTYFSSKEIPELTKCFDKYYYTIPHEFSSIIDSIFKNLYKESLVYHTDSSLLIKNYVTLLLTILNRLRSRQEISNVTTDTIIKDSLVYISKHISENLSLQHVAQHVALNPSYFSRKFKAVVGTNFREYIIFLRISKAEQLLTSSKLSVSEISYICGFHDSNYFSVVFKKIVGISPVKFRKQNKI